MPTFLLYLRVQLMTFVFGIVGPIFLTVYFAAQPDPTLKWMYFAGLVITGIDVLVALAITDRMLAARRTRPPVEPNVEPES